MKRILSILIVIAPFFVIAQPADFRIDQIYPIDNGHSYVGFETTYMGYAKVKGRFAKFNGSFRYVEGDITKTSVSISIDVASIDTDLDFRDNDLRSENWFNALEFPKITFVSTMVKETEEGLLVAGKLTIKDVTKEIQLSMDKSSGVLNDIRGDRQVIFTGTLVLNRKDYGVQGDRWSRIKEGITAVSEEVKIDLSILGKRIQKSNFSNRIRNVERPQGVIYKAYKEEGLERALVKYGEMVADPEEKIHFGILNIVGYMMLKEGATKDAEIVFKKNMEQFPDNPFAYDSYGEVLAAQQKWQKSRKYYEMALSMNPDNMNALEILKHFN